jgi:acyl carrier protein
MDVDHRIRRFITETFFVDDFGDEDSFLQNGVIDSAGMVEMVAFVQKTFEIEIGDSELVPDNLDSVSKLTRFVERKRRETTSA